MPAQSVVEDVQTASQRSSHSRRGCVLQRVVGHFAVLGDPEALQQEQKQQQALSDLAVQSRVIHGWPMVGWGQKLRDQEECRTVMEQMKSQATWV